MHIFWLTTLEDRARFAHYSGIVLEIIGIYAYLKINE